MASVDLVGLSKPATALVNRIADAVDVRYEPKRVRKLAEAKADAAVIAAEGEIRAQDVRRRAAHRWIEEEAQKQLNIESITAKALPRLPDDADPSSMTRDWITNFFEKSRIVTDEDMQQLWSTILAGEATRPGTFSRKTVNVVGDLEKADAELFTRLCGFCWTTDVFGSSHIPLVFGTREEIYTRRGIDLVSLGQLESVGLISLSSTGYTLGRPDDDEVTLGYFGDHRIVDLRRVDHGLHVGYVLLTKAGTELLPICGSEPVAGFLDYVEDRWHDYGMRPVQVAKIGTLVIP